MNTAEKSSTMQNSISFQEWSDTAQTEYTCHWGYRQQGIRDIYTLPNGVRIHDEVWMPYSIFKPQQQATLVDIIFPESKKEWLKEQGADFDEDRYTDEGFGYPLFVGENSTERAWNFAMNLPQEVCHGIHH